MKLYKFKCFLPVVCISFAICCSSTVDAQSIKAVHVDELDIQMGYVSRRIDLKHYAKPTIQLTSLQYTPVDEIPEEALPSSPEKFDIILGRDRKKPFAVVRIPAYSYSDAGMLQKLSDFKIEYKETATTAPDFKRRSVAKGTANPNSPLATGSWHKISVWETGLYKIDYNFLVSQIGISGGIPSTNIRLFGSGGKMLPEQNRKGEIKGLTETAIQVFDGGDGSFDQGDYFIFYAQGALNFYPSDDNEMLLQEKNYYIDNGYYFLNFDQPGGLRIDNQTNVPVETTVSNTFSGVALHEEDWANPQQFGKRWWGEELSSAPGKENSVTIKLDLSGFSGELKYKLHVVNTASSAGVFTIYLNGQQMDVADVSAANIGLYPPKAIGQEIEWTVPHTSNTAEIRIDYSCALTDGSGYLDYIRVNGRRALNISGKTLLFTDLKTIGDGNVARYNLSNANSGTQVWDVTDAQHPIMMNGSLSGSNYSFVQSAEQLHRFIAINSTDVDVPEYKGAVANQNIFGSPAVDYIIVTYPDFKPAAERLAEFHRNRSGMRVLVATTTQVYNEFSSGGQDMSAIRDLARMFYDRAGMNDADMPRYFLLMGDASYDYKDRINNNTNFVPTFEAYQSFSFLGTYSNDDFFGFLDEGENIERYDIVNALDLGVGRIPAKSLKEAEDVVSKIIHYKSPASLGDWRLSTMYIADDGDEAGDHLNDAEVMNASVTSNSNIHNPTKVYQDALPEISTPGGKRAPEANKTINDGIFKGAFLINYSGHGNTSVLSHERIVTKDDYNKWRNLDKLPIMVTATCDFGQFDQPSFVSSGEELMLKGDGGVIATLTTTHLVYAYANEILNKEFLAAQFQQINGRWNTFGDALRIGKNGTYGKASPDIGLVENFRKFALLGDPALEPNFPEYFIHTTSVTDGATGEVTNEINALGEYIINGEVTDVNGNVLSDFNGLLAVTIFDKPRTVKTNTYYGEKVFEVQNNTIYKGKATVADGKFSFSFITPKDINYELGNGNVSYYADNGVTDGAGRDTSVVIGGYSDNPRIEYDAPIVKAYIKDSLFQNGGLTGTNTAIFAVLEDETGINVSGNAVGHDLIAILDGDVANPYVMNDYYETAPNTYKKGFVYFPVEGIPDGRHRFTIKAWDVNNNSGVGYVDFVVADGQIVKVKNLMNYPNPFNDQTNFVFEHNHPDEDLAAEINIYTTSGVHVRKLKQNFRTEGSKSMEVTWDATDNNGAKLPAGVYIYRMMIITEQGISETAYQKLVIVR